MLFVTFVTSMYFFPFEFTFLPGINTKMVLAGLGLVLLFVNLARGTQGGEINRDFFNLSIWAMLISGISFVAITFNETYDYTFTTYIISMWVWLGGAYTTTRLMKVVHGYLNVTLICHYLIVVCIGQCAVAYAMDFIPTLKDYVDGFLGSSGFMGKVENRLYGIGAALDVAGSRFAAILLIIGYLCVHVKKDAGWFLRGCYIFSFFVIMYVGNMISRTTVVGGLVTLIYWFFILLMGNNNLRLEAKRTWLLFGGMLLVSLPIVVYYYHVNTSIHNNIRFAFEGFFSLVEKGRWETTSNEMLKNMYVFPDNVKTWLIGDGYFDNPYNLDLYYTGPNWAGFYKQTDVGYLRFVFYAGVFCMLAFIVYFFKVARVCICRFRGYALLFLAILLLNYIVWFKVSSDLFPVFAIFLCVTTSDLEIIENTKCH